MSQKEPQSHSILNPLWVCGIVVAIFAFFVMPISKGFWHVGKRTLNLEWKLALILGGISALTYLLIFLRDCLRKGWGDKVLFIVLVIVFAALILLSTFMV